MTHYNFETVETHELHLHVQAAGETAAPLQELAAAVMTGGGESAAAELREPGLLVLPPLPRGTWLYEVRAGNRPLLHGHITVSAAPAFAAPGADAYTLVAGVEEHSITITAAEGPRGPQGEKGERGAQGPQGVQGERGEEPLVSRTHTTPAGTGNTWANYAVIAPQHYEAGELRQLTLRARSTSSGSHPIWLGVFEQPEGGGNDPAGWVFLGVSQQAVVQQNNTESVWTFEGVQLSGRPIALCAMAAPDTGWNMATQFGAWAAPRPAGDDSSSLVARSAIDYLPQMSLTVAFPISRLLAECWQGDRRPVLLTEAEQQRLRALLG